MDFKKKAEAEAPLSTPKPRLVVPIQGTILHKPDGSVLGVICGHGWVANEDGSPTMRPVVNVIVPTDTHRKMVVALPAEMADASVEEEAGDTAPRIVAPV